MALSGHIWGMLRGISRVGQMCSSNDGNTIMDIAKLYTKRFNPAERSEKNLIWQVLCQDFFQRYIRRTDTVIDLGAGYCEFINNIHAEAKIAVDLNEDTSVYAAPDVRVLKSPSTDMRTVADASVDVVFASNFFEHLPNKQEFLKTLQEIRRVLRAGGRLLILQPNIRFLHGEYWDFLDHHIPLTDRTLVEALEVVGFNILEVRPRFLPYTTKSRLPQRPWLVRLYLRVPIAHHILGKQAWVVAAKP
jgi:SAM-dependent methyltransferase